MSEIENTSENNFETNGLVLERLGQLTVMILDPDIRAAQVTRSLLTLLGVSHTRIERDYRDALDTMRDKQIDMLVISSQGQESLDFVIQLRQAEDSPNRLIPIIITSYDTSMEFIGLTRDVGIDEFIACPFSANSMQGRLNSIIDNPRNFILAKDFVGPDRRRGRESKPGEIICRRDEKKPVIITPLALMGGMIRESTPHIILPTFALKEKIEVAPKMLGLDILLSSSEAEKHSNEFLQSVLVDLNTMRQAFKNLIKIPAHSMNFVENIGRASKSVQERATRMGYVLGSRVAGQLADFCLSKFTRDQKNHPIVIEKHIDTLNAIFAHKLGGTGGPVGEELFNELVLLVHKYVR